MKIALIVPPSRLDITSFPKKLSRFYFSEGLKTPPIGVAYIATILLNKNHNVKIFDCNDENFSDDELFVQLIEFSPDVIGFSLVPLIFPIFVPLIQKIKKRFESSIFIVGGLQLTYYPEETLKIDEIDIGVIGEGESTISELIDALEKGSSLDNINGIIFKKDGRIIKTNERRLISDLDTIPFPAYDLLDMKKYFVFFSKNNIQTFSILGARGCPFSCNYCSERFTNYRRRSVQNVLNEILFLYNNYSVRYIHFNDPTFSVNKIYTMELCNAIIKANLNLNFSIRTRVDCVDEEIIFKLKEAGCDRIHFGLESGSDEILKRLGKKETISMQKQVIELTKKSGIEIMGFFMIGNPGDTIETIESTIEYAKSLHLDYAQFARLNVLMGTPLYEEYLKNGGKNIWYDFVTGKSDARDVQLQSVNLSIEELDKMVYKAYKKFYFRVSFIWKKIRKIDSLSTLFKYIRASLAII